MAKDLRLRLKEKGWSDEELDTVENIFEDANKEKSFLARFLERSLYWIVLFLIILGNIFCSLILIPILLTLQGAILFLTIGVLAIGLGALLQYLLIDIQRYAHTHHVLLGLFLPVIALINVYIATNLANFMSRLWHIPLFTHSPVVISIFYVAAFSFPYLFSLRKRASSQQKPQQRTPSQYTQRSY